MSPRLPEPAWGEPAAPTPSYTRAAPAQTFLPAAICFQGSGAGRRRGGAGAEQPPAVPRFPAPGRGSRPPTPATPSPTPAGADTRLRCLNRNLLQTPSPPPGPGRRPGSAGRRPARRPPWPRRGEVGAAAAVARTGRSSDADRPPGPGRRGGRGSRPLVAAPPAAHGEAPPPPPLLTVRATLPSVPGGGRASAPRCARPREPGERCGSRAAEDGEHYLVLRVVQPQAPEECPLPAGVLSAWHGPESRGHRLQPAAHQRPGEHRRWARRARGWLWWGLARRPRPRGPDCTLASASQAAWLSQPGSGNLELGFPLTVPRGSGGGTLPGGARVPQAEGCRRPGDRSWALSLLVTKHEGAALGGGSREPGVPGTVW